MLGLQVCAPCRMLGWQACIPVPNAGLRVCALCQMLGLWVCALCRMLGVQMCAPCLVFKMWMLGIELGSSCLHGRHSTNQAFFLASIQVLCKTCSWHWILNSYINKIILTDLYCLHLWYLLVVPFMINHNHKEICQIFPWGNICTTYILYI